MSRPLNFAVVGAGYIFDRHLAAIEHIGGKLICVNDVDATKKDKLDSGVRFFRTFEGMKDWSGFDDVDVVVICTPNHTHNEFAVRSIREKKTVLLEKPPVLSIQELIRLDGEMSAYKQDVFVVLQLRESEKLQALKKKFELTKPKKVRLDIAMHRGGFYWDGWKGDRKRSGGLLFNIGVHYLDVVLWLFGTTWKDFTVEELNNQYGKGTIDLGETQVEWVIDLLVDKDKQARNLYIDDEKINLTRILESLHNRVYERLAEGDGTRIEEAIPVLNLCEAMTETWYESHFN